MSKIAGIKIEKDLKGTPKILHINLKKLNQGFLEEMEDLLDRIEIESRKDEESIPWEIVKKNLDKKHGIKHV